MSTQVQYRRGTGAQNDAFTGALAELTVDTTSWTLRVHDGVTPGGGGNLATVAYVDNAISSLSANSITDGTSSVTIIATNGNIRANVGGSTIQLLSSAGANVTGFLTATGNVTGNFILGNGSQLTGIDATSIQNGTANARTFLNGNVTISAAGTANVAVITGTGANIDGTLNVTGNVIGANLNTGGVIIATGNVTGGNLVTGAQVVATGNVTGGNLVTTGNIVAGNLIVTGIEAVTTLNVSGDTLISGNLTVSGNTITANVASIVITDPILGLGRGANGDPLTSNDGLDRGIEMFYYNTDERIAFMGFDNNEGKMLSAANVSIANNIVTVNSYGTTVVGTLEVGNIVNSNANGVGNIGSSTTFFNTVFAQATSAQYADLAERYLADQSYAPGTVVEIAGSAEVTETTAWASTRIAGVVSADPAFIMNSGAQGEHVVSVALLGRVPCCVTGTVQRGDLLCSSIIPGHAMSMAIDQYRPGAVIGKALQDHGQEGTGVIEVLVGRL